MLSDGKSWSGRDIGVTSRNTIHLQDLRMSQRIPLIQSAVRAGAQQTRQGSINALLVAEPPEAGRDCPDFFTTILTSKIRACRSIFDTMRYLRVAADQNRIRTD